MGWRQALEQGWQACALFGKTLSAFYVLSKYGVFLSRVGLVHPVPAEAGLSVQGYAACMLSPGLLLAGPAFHPSLQPCAIDFQRT